MPLSHLKAHALSHHYGGELLFRDVSLVVNRGDRIGLVGPNGVGKTTLLRVLAGQLRPAYGHVSVAPGTRIGWAGGPAQRDGDHTVGSFLASGLSHLASVTAQMRALESALSAGDHSVLADYARIQDEWTALRGWSADSQVDNVRDRLGLRDLPDDLPLAKASGGEQARLTLARLLLTDPDVLVLDEPTNHLDADGASWLGDYLARFTGGVLVASHDRQFLDQAVSQIIELDGIDPAPNFYLGGYSDYRQEKAQRWQHRLLEFEAQQKYRRRLEADIDAVKNQALQTELSTHNDKLRRYAKKVAKKAKARERRLERQIQSATWLAEPQTRPPLVLAMPGTDALDSSDLDNAVLSACGVSVSLGGRKVLRDVDLRVTHGDRILISGPNGAGKSTLLRTLTGRLEPDVGIVTSTPTAMLPQRHEDLPLKATVLDYFRSQVPMYAEDAERLLSGYLFGPDEWHAPLRNMSEGEQRRLLLAALVNAGASVLALDEPTHYLDFDALDVVEAALAEYQGTLIMVTHDQYFADRVGYNRCWRVGDGAVTELASAGRLG